MTLTELDKKPYIPSTIRDNSNFCIGVVHVPRADTDDEVPDLIPELKMGLIRHGYTLLEDELSFKDD